MGRWKDSEIEEHNRPSGARAPSLAVAFDLAARQQLQRLALPPTSAEVARRLGYSRSYWHACCSGARPSGNRALEWLRAWADAGLPPITLRLDVLGAIAESRG